MPRNSTLWRPARKTPCAAGVRRELELPYLLCDWHRLGNRWLEDGFLDFYADLAAHFWEHGGVADAQLTAL